MRVGDKILFFDENNKQFTAKISALRDPKLNPEGKVIRKNLIDVKVCRMTGVFQTYERTPLKSDLQEGEKTFYYTLFKKQKKSTTDTDKIKGTTKKIKSIFGKNSQ